MDLDSERGQRGLEEYRRRLGFGEGREQAVLDRLRSSIEQGQQGLAIASTDEGPAAVAALPQHSERDPAPRKLAIGIAVAACLVAVGIGLAWFISTREGVASQAGDPHQAAYPRTPLDGDTAANRNPPRTAVQFSRASNPDGESGADGNYARREGSDQTDQPPHSPVGGDTGSDDQSTDESPERKRTNHKRPKRADDPSTTMQTAETLAAELKLLRAARAAVANDDPKRALAQLEQHRAAHPHGQLAQDRDALRVELLCQTNPARGRKAKRAFLRRFPKSSHRSRIESQPCSDE